MNRSSSAVALLGVLVCAPWLAAQEPRTASPAPPVARVSPRELVAHGDRRIDNYFWLRDRNDPEVISYLTAENQYTEAATAHTKALQEKLYREMLGRIKQTDLSVPVRRGPYLYYTRTEEGKQYRIHARRRGTGAREEVLLDENELARGKRYLTVGAFAVSPDHNLLAFTVDTTGAEYFTLHFKDLRTGRLLPDRVDSVHFGLTWAADNRTVLYIRTDAAQRPNRVVRHTLGTPTTSDVVVREEPDELFRVYARRTKDDRYLIVGSNSFTTSEAGYIPADRPTDPVRVIAPRERGVEYSVDHHGDRFLILTNADGATNFKLVTAPEADPSRRNWRELIAHRDSVLLDDVEVFSNFLVLTERSQALPRIRVREWRTGAEHTVTFPEQVYTASVGNNPEFRSDTLRFSYSSLVTPSSVYDYNLRTRQRKLLKRDEVLGGFDPGRYATERSWARAGDGTLVPVSLVYRKPLARNGTRPLLLYAYGSYGSNVDPYFQSTLLSLLDRGVVYAIAHIRGGQEMGRAWYEQGKMFNKKNTFTDFIAVAEHLIREGYTSRERLAIRGGSAGGLLMGAVVNLRPDLFRVVVADVPFVDVVTTMQDASIPLTAGEWEQWGDPRKPEDYAYMKSYSPYDNLERKAYPAMLVTTGLNDPRVAYWEPVKWVAKLRAMKTDSNVLLLKTNMGAGHGGSSGRYDALREAAFRYAFVLDQLGIRE